jgi:hypothetical protein
MLFNKKGLSGVITAVILIALAMAVTGIIWFVISNLVEDQLEGVESCFGIYEKVEINEKYTCYDSINEEVQFSINVGDIELEELIVSLEGIGGKQSIILNGTNAVPLNYLKYYGGVYGGEPSPDIVKMPSKNGGRTYVVGGNFPQTSSPDLIEIIPIIKGKQCDVIDTITNIVDCRVLS